jgi:predicted dithiol-disulfide oxidoreductase (DUF899 family)
MSKPSDERMNGAYKFRDLVPKGRDEQEHPDRVDLHGRNQA